MDNNVILLNKKVRRFRIPFIDKLSNVSKTADMDNRIKSILEEFFPEKWNNKSTSEKFLTMIDYATYHIDKLQIKGVIKFGYRMLDNKHEYGGYDIGKKEIIINQRCFNNPFILVNVIAHECKHAQQHERMLNPKTKEDFEFKANYEDYITAEEDYQAYLRQPLEKDAIKYANNYFLMYKGLMEELGYIKPTRKSLLSKLSKISNRGKEKRHIEHRKARSEREWQM